MYSKKKKKKLQGLVTVLRTGYTRPIHVYKMEPSHVRRVLYRVIPILKAPAAVVICYEFTAITHQTFGQLARLVKESLLEKTRAT